MNNETLSRMRDVFTIESECIREMESFFDEDAYSKAVELLKNAPRIGASGCGHSGIMCRHFAHLMCCIERAVYFTCRGGARSNGVSAGRRCLRFGIARRQNQRASSYYGYMQKERR